MWVYNTDNIPDCVDNVGYRSAGNNANGQSSEDNFKSKTIELDFGVTELNVRVVPNPGKGIFSVTIFNGREENNNIIKVIDAFSQKIKDFNAADSFILNLSDEPPGVYFLQILTANSMQTFKLIKQ